MKSNYLPFLYSKWFCIYNSWTNVDRLFWRRGSSSNYIFWTYWCNVFKIHIFKSMNATLKLALVLKGLRIHHQKTHGENWQMISTFFWSSPGLDEASLKRAIKSCLLRTSKLKAKLNFWKVPSVRLRSPVNKEYDKGRFEGTCCILCV